MPGWYALTVPQIETLPIPPPLPETKWTESRLSVIRLVSSEQNYQILERPEHSFRDRFLLNADLSLYGRMGLCLYYIHTCVCWGEDKGLLKALAMIRFISTPVLFLTHIDLSHWMACSGSVGFSQASSSSQMWRGGGGRMNSGRKWPIIRIVQWATIHTYLIFILLSEVQECL